MDAIETLEQQLREVEAMFKKYDELGDKATKSKLRLLEQIADALALHATIEQKDFCPDVKAEYRTALFETV